MLLRGAAAPGTPRPPRPSTLALSTGTGSERRTPSTRSARSLPSSGAGCEAVAGAPHSEASGNTPAEQLAEASASTECNGLRSVDDSPALGGTAQRSSRRTGEASDQGSSCSGGGGGSTGLSGEPSAGPEPQPGHASAFSSILQRSGPDALALLTPESRHAAGGALPGRLGLWLGSQTLACPTGLSPLAVLATPAALPSWLDRRAQAAPCPGPVGQAAGLLQALPAPLSPLSTPAWLRDTPPAEGPQPGQGSADSARTPPEHARLWLVWETPSGGAPACAGGPPPGGTSAGSEGSAAGEAEHRLRWLTQSPEGPGGCSACGSGRGGAGTPMAACATALSQAGSGRGSPSAQGSAKGLLASAERGSPSAQGLAEGGAGSPALAGSAPDSEASPSPLPPSFQGFRAPLAPSAQALTEPWDGPASSSPSAAAAAEPWAPGSSPQAVSAWGSSPKTLNLSPYPHQGCAPAPDTAERRLVDRLHAQLDAGSGSHERASHRTGAAPAATERRATFLRAIDRLQAR